ncbi:hypothetical protein QBZ16_001643 [Prototheca wickerhamii]|uniref:Uncharacterized protein n=1 Tax=Prototheca wickerhamii TaxID=3111 RepID=A0AAD9IEH6_PROWI|nr:hypothetical protein QBZ16_001643 [Prototheca wickerhamii]
MNPVYYKSGYVQSSPSLLNLTEWQEKEKANPVNCAVDKDGQLLDNLTLELRVSPPEITIDNSCHERYTFVKLTSANMPGSLIHVVQHFKELGLHVHRSRVTSCGGWFVDDFYLTEPNGQKIRSPSKLHSIEQMMVSYFKRERTFLNGDETDDDDRVVSTVFELAGPDGVGLLADVTTLLQNNGCNVRGAAVWTYHGRVAFVLSTTEHGLPIADPYKRQRLRQLVTAIMAGRAGASEAVTVRLEDVRGEVHPDRRLHRLMLNEELELWKSGSGRRFLSCGGQTPRGVSGYAFDSQADDDDDEGVEEEAGDASPHDHGDSDDALLDVHGMEEHDAVAGPAGVYGAAPDLTVEAERPQQRHGRRQPSLRARRADASAPADGPLSPASVLAAPEPGSSLTTTASPGASPPPARRIKKEHSADVDGSWRSPKYDRPIVDLELCRSSGYWIVSIACRDRPKLLFDTVCTLADLNYDIWHATIDAFADGSALQEYHIRPRFGDQGWDEGAAACLKAMLEGSIQRRFPRGIKLHVRSVDRFGGLGEITRVLKEARLSITRAKVRTYVASNSSGHTFYVLGEGGAVPGRERIAAVCASLGAALVDEAKEGSLRGAGSAGCELSKAHRFTMAYLERHAGSPISSSVGSV